jgi:hypothetical protein
MSPRIAESRSDEQRGRQDAAPLHHRSIVFFGLPLGLPGGGGSSGTGGGGLPFQQLDQTILLDQQLARGPVAAQASLARSFVQSSTGSSSVRTTRKGSWKTQRSDRFLPK